MTWPNRPTDWGRAGHANRDIENEEIADQIQAVSDATLLDWQTWVPTLTNLTLGSGSSTGRYLAMGQTVFWRWVFIMGAGSAVGTGPRITLPYAPHGTAHAQTPLGRVDITNAATASYEGVVKLVSGSTVEMFYFDASCVAATITATAPFAFGSADSISVAGMFERA